MPARRSESVAALVVAAAALLLTCVFGFLSFTPGVDPEIGGFLEVAFLMSGLVTLGAGIAYFVMSRKTDSGEERSKFDRLLEQRKAALSAVPIGIGAVLIGAAWYMTKMLGEGGAWSEMPGSQTFAAIDTAGIAAFLGIGSVYVVGATYLAIRAERAALRLAREDTEVAA